MTSRCIWKGSNDDDQPKMALWERNFLFDENLKIVFGNLSS